MVADMRLGGICGGCQQRLGVDERLTRPLSVLQVSQLPEFNPKLMEDVRFTSPTIGQGASGTTKITYKIAKTVKEAVEEH